MRCTQATLEALGVKGECPHHGTGVISALSKHYRTAMSEPNVTLRRFVAEHPKGSFYLATRGHAIALVDGVLTDTEQRGADGRRVWFAQEILERKH